MKYNLDDPAEHQNHLDILASGSEEDAADLIAEIQKLPLGRQINYLYPHTLRLTPRPEPVEMDLPKIDRSLFDEACRSGNFSKIEQIIKDALQ